MGVLPQNIFGLNGVKSCYFRQNKHENALSWEPGIVCITIWVRFSIIYTEKIIIIRLKQQPLDPLSYPSNIHTRPQLWQISGGGGGGFGPLVTDPPLSGPAHVDAPRGNKVKVWQNLSLVIRFMTDLLRKYRSVVIMVGWGGASPHHVHNWPPISS